MNAFTQLTDLDNPYDEDSYPYEPEGYNMTDDLVYQPTYTADGVRIEDLTIEERLKLPFEDVKWRLQQTHPKGLKAPYPAGTRGMFLAYIDARQLYDRLDDVLGFGNWSAEPIAVHGEHSITGRLSIFIDGEWKSQSDIGYSNSPGTDSSSNEPLKAAASDAYKRAGVLFGIGRYLYALEPEWHPIDEWGKKIENAQNQAVQTHQTYTPSNSPRGTVTTLTTPQNAPQLPPRPDNYNGPSEKQLGWLKSLWKDIDPEELDAIALYNDIDLNNLTGGRGGTASRLIDLLRARNEAPTNPTF